MANLVMVESWVGAAGHSYVLVTRDPALYGTTALGIAHPVVRDADEVVVADTNDPTALLAAVESVVARRPVDGVLTTCDYYLVATAAVAERLGLPGAAPDVMRAATRKDLVRRAL